MSVKFSLCTLEERGSSSMLYITEDDATDEGASLFTVSVRRGATDPAYYSPIVYFDVDEPSTLQEREQCFCDLSL